MKLALKKFAVQASIVSFAAFALIPMHAKALVPPLLQFGGWDDFTVVCTCSGASWGFFGPLYLSPEPVAGALVYVPYGTVPLADFQITVPSVPHKGAYIPGIQACWEYVGVSCVPIPSIGVMAFVGTGLEGGK